MKDKHARADIEGINEKLFDYIAKQDKIIAILNDSIDHLTDISKKAAHAFDLFLDHLDLEVVKTDPKPGGFIIKKKERE